MPLHQSATYVWESLDKPPAHDYTRVSNPTRACLEKVIASLEGGGHCLSTNSGMSAIYAAFSFLKSGDCLMAAKDIYGGTQRIIDKILPGYNIDVVEFDPRDLDSFDAAVPSNAKMLVFETPSNPNLRVADIARIAEVSKRHGLISVIDNTFASPALQNPLLLGVDISVHSTTKYICGHSDVIGGAVCTLSDDLYGPMYEWGKSVGTAPSPFDCWLQLRGVKTLAVRMKQHCENALAVAEFLKGHPSIDEVFYPGLESDPGHQIAKKQMSGFGGMVSCTVKGGFEGTAKVAEGCEIFLLAESLGAVESLIGYPARMSHAAMPEEERVRRGIPNNMLRLSIGIEDADDLIADLKQALARVRI